MGSATMPPCLDIGAHRGFKQGHPQGETMYSKATETAIAAMTRLAEVYDRGRTRLSAVEIAESRG